MQYRNGQRLPLDGGEGTLRLSVNSRARRISIRIDVRAGEAVAVAPNERRLAEAVTFARSRNAWILERLTARPVGTPLQPGGTVTLSGHPVRLVAGGGAGAARLSTDETGPIIISGGEGEAFSRRVRNLLKREARRALVARTDIHLQALGQKPVQVSIADGRSRWGSCSPHNRTIRYSWRVIMAPPAVLDYLAAHEVAHLVHANHSPAYWAVVRDLIGDPSSHRRWLRDHGASLHAVGR
ncbi:SprT family zinc-dependent metalloprotease [uncultured Brevundimonas sp.]|uniref:M48 family metallopeptidase n=1 Tax=uncultured Brevundimonas sp. TaxID=213418 RepID=UPI0030EEC941